VAPAFLEVVTSQEIRRWLGARAVAASTRNKYRRTLHAALAWAVREGLLVANPCDGIPLAREDRRPAVILARPEDRRAFFAGMDARGAAWGAVARLAYAAGLRAQELGHLTWRSVDLAERYLLIQPEPAGGGCRLADWSREWGPKNHQLAALALDNESVARLASLRRKAVADLVQGGMGAEGAERLCAFSTARAPGLRVFGNANPDGFGKAFRRACREVCEVEGLPPIRPHGLRKTFGTVLAGRGMGEFQLAQVMRHANPQTTRDYYVLLQQRQTSTEALRLLAIEDNVPHKKGKRA
jgi:integrase